MAELKRECLYTMVVTQSELDIITAALKLMLDTTEALLRHRVDEMDNIGAATTRAKMGSIAELYSTLAKQR